MCHGVCAPGGRGRQGVAEDAICLWRARGVELRYVAACRRNAAYGLPGLHGPLAGAWHCLLARLARLKPSDVKHTARTCMKLSALALAAGRSWKPRPMRIWPL